MTAAATASIKKSDFMPRLNEIVAEAVEANPNDIPEAVCKAMEDVRAKYPTEYKNWRDDLVRMAIQGMVTDRRHSVNRTVKAGAATRFGESSSGTIETDSGTGLNGTGSRQNESRAGKGADVLEATYQTIYGYFIAGRTLGELTLDDLSSIEEDQRNKAHGLNCNAALMAWIRSTGLMKKGKTVRQCIKPKMLQENFDRIFGSPQPQVKTVKCDSVSA